MGLFQRLKNLDGKRLQPSVEKEPPGPAEIPGGREITGPMGSCLLFENSAPGEYYFPAASASPLSDNLKLIRGIGPITEERLKQEGHHTLENLLGHPRWGSHAAEVKEMIEEMRVKEIRGLGACDLEVLCLFRPRDVVFLDIESTGLWASQPLFLIGLLFSDGGKFVMKQFFARHYREEKAVLEAVHSVLKCFKVIVTFNGKRFDIPYIEGRSVEHRLFYRYHHFQVDLLYHARRRFSATLPDCRLATLEERILEFQRQGDIPGYLIPETYHRYVRTRDARFILPVIDHNRMDLLSMTRLFHLVEANDSA